jgi:hypothetical protein
MNTKGAFLALAVLLCLVSANGRKLLDVQVQVSQAAALHCTNCSVSLHCGCCGYRRTYNIKMFSYLIFQLSLATPASGMKGFKNAAVHCCRLPTPV